MVVLLRCHRTGHFILAAMLLLLLLGMLVVVVSSGTAPALPSEKVKWDPRIRTGRQKKDGSWDGSWDGFFRKFWKNPT